MHPCPPESYCQKRRVSLEIGRKCVGLAAGTGVCWCMDTGAMRIPDKLAEEEEKKWRYDDMVSWNGWWSSTCDPQTGDEKCPGWSSASAEWQKGNQNNMLVGIFAKPREKAALTRVRWFTVPCSAVRDEGRVCLHWPDTGRSSAVWQGAASHDIPRMPYTSTM